MPPEGGILITFGKKFSEENVLNCLSETTPRAIVVIQKCVGCSRNTVKPLLDNLERSEKIKKIEIEGLGFGYIKV